MADSAGLNSDFSELRDQLREMQRSLDELRCRQVITTSDNILAIRHRLGWLFVPQEDTASITHLADGVSGHETGTVSVIERIVEPGDIVIDIGAHIGLMTLPLARMVGPFGRVIAVEPMQRNAACLGRALLSNGVSDRCEVIVAAATDREGSVEFFLGVNSMMGSLIPEVDNQKFVEVREVRLENHVCPGTAVSLVKMDVEGAELTTLAGIERIVADNPDLILIAEFGPSHLERVGTNPEDWFAAFERAGFKHRYSIDEATSALKDITVTEISKCFSINVLFSRNGHRLERLMSVGRNS